METRTKHAERREDRAFFISLPCHHGRFSPQQVLDDQRRPVIVWFQVEKVLSGFPSALMTTTSGLSAVPHLWSPTTSVVITRSALEEKVSTPATKGTYNY